MLITRLSIPDDVGNEWPFSLPGIGSLAQGVELTAPVAFLVGENGSGKSTIIEAIADACRINSGGGKAGTKYASTGEITQLGEVIDVQLTGTGRRLIHGSRLKRRAFFFRAETLFNLAQHVSGLVGFWEGDLNGQSHGEGFFTVIDRMVTGPGLYLMDEPEAALSFSSCLRLIGAMAEVADDGGQIICATHSPLLASLPGAQILELGDHGIRVTEWDKLQLVDHWRRYLAKPDFYLRYVLNNAGDTEQTV